MYKVTRRLGKPVIETFENENVIITRYVSGEVEAVLKKTADEKVKKMFEELFIEKGVKI